MKLDVVSTNEVANIDGDRSRYNYMKEINSTHGLSALQVVIFNTVCHFLPGSMGYRVRCQTYHELANTDGNRTGCNYMREIYSTHGLLVSSTGGYF